jgi:colicin import membrane protein
MSGEGREFAINLVLSLVLHFLVFAGVFLTPSLYSQQFQVPVAYKVTLVDLPGTRRAIPSRKQASAVKPQPPKSSAQVAPSKPKVRAKAKTSTVKPSSREQLALPKKGKVARKRPKSAAPGATESSSAPPGKAQAALPSVAAVGPGDGGLAGIVSESSVSTDNADPSLSYYLTAIQAKVSSRWIEPSMGLKLGRAERVTLGFTVLRSGLVRDIRVLTASGNVFLDQSALRAVQEAVPLPPFPPLFAEKTLLVRFHFEMRGQ